MVRIGIVDDEKKERIQLRKEIARFETEYGLKFEIYEFDSAGPFLATQAHSFDILFLDIDMPQMSGMELAEKIRETDHEVILIFCTNLQQFALNGYCVSALGFIVKPVQWYSLHMYMERAMKLIRKRASQQNGTVGKQIVVKNGAISKLIDSSEIEYVEVQQHELLYNLRDKATGQKTVVKNRGTMQEVTALLSPYGFVRCSSSFLVNLRCITAVSRMYVYIGQKTLSIGRAYKDTFTEAFSKYLAKREWENP